MRPVQRVCCIVGAALLVVPMAKAADRPVAAASGAFTIINAIHQAVTTNPGVGEAAANRRATEAEMRQVQGTLLPQVRLEAKAGNHRFNHQDVLPPPTANRTWQRGWEGSIVARQLLFDGLTSINEIWRQAARVNAAALRVHERTELIALDAAEAYIDVVRFTHLVSLATENIEVHRRILGNVDARFQGGRAGEGDLEQVRERVEAAIAIRAQFLQQLDEARGAFRKVIGIEPYNLRIPGRLRGLPASKDASLAITLRHNPTIQAGEADRDAARHGFNATAGTLLPQVSVEARATRGNNIGTVVGRQTEASAFVVANWDIFTGFKNEWRRAEFAERYQEQTMRHARLQREAFELIDKAWAARTITGERIAALLRQIAADRRVITAYQQEYELGQRSLIDLLNAQNQLFNARVSLESTRGTAVFADFQLLAAMGQLLSYLKQPHPVDAEVLHTRPFGVFPMRLPPVLFKLPEPGPEPLNVSASHSMFPHSGPPGALRAYATAPTPTIAPTETAATPAGSFANRWPEGGSRSWAEGVAPRPQASPQAPAASGQQPSTAPARNQPLELGPQVSAFGPRASTARSSLPAWLTFPTRAD